MKLLRLAVAVSIIGTLFLPIVAFASNVSDALWLGIVQVSNNGTATTGVSVNFSANSTSFINGGFMNSSGNNTAMQYSGSDVAYMPGYANNPWVVFVSSINQNELQNDSLYMGGSDDMTAKLSYFPASGGMAVTDAASLEPGANFTFQLTDTRLTDGLILYKAGAAAIVKNSTNVTFYNAGMSATSNNQTTKDTYEAAYSSQPRVGQRVDSFIGFITEVRFWASVAGAPTGTANITVRKVSDDSLLAILGTIDVSTIGGGAEYTFNTNSVALAIQTDIRILFEYSGGDGGNYVAVESKNANASAFGQVTTYNGATYTDVPGRDMYFRVFYNSSGVNVSSIADGEYDLTVTADSTNVWMQVGSSVSANVSVAAVPDNANPWQWGGTGTTYIGTMRETVGGVTKGLWDWDYGTTFADQSGNGNTGMPSFRTTSSDADVSATLIQFAPISEADAPTYSVDSPPDFVTANITATGNFTTNMTGPAAVVITDVSNASNTPVNFVILTISLIVLVVLAYLISWLMRKAGTESQLVKGLVLVGVFGILFAIHAIDSLVFYLFAFFAVGIVAVSKSRDMEGTGNTNNNLFGFLIMSWLGMTMINRLLEGALITTAERSIMNSITVFQPWNVFGIFTLPVPNIGFLTTGVPALMRWDYSFFGGSGQILTYLMYSITGVVSVVFLGYALSSASSIFSRSR